jgi:hypothetical protein
MIAKDYSILEVFNNTIMGFNFEFYSSKKVDFIAEDLSKSLAKSVVITGNDKSIPTWSSPVLVKEYNGKRPRYQLKISQQDYNSILPGIKEVLNWINENAALDYSTKMSVLLSFNHRNLQTLSTISNMDIAKMILKIDEGFLYEKFPQMEKSPFSLSVKKFIPFNGFVNVSNPIFSLNTSFQLPISEYYGTDFTQQPMGILKFNYIGGTDYANNPHNVFESLKYYIITAYQSLNSSGYTLEMQKETDKLMEGYKKIRRSYYDSSYFLKTYPDIKVYVDLREGEQITKTYWDKIRNPLLKLVLESDLRKGKFNWDSQTGKFELKNASLEGVRINGFHLVNCKVRGLIENCLLWKTDVENSRLKNSTLVNGNNINISLIESCRADRGNSIKRSYIINEGEIINCEVNESIIKNAGLGKNARIDENSTVVEDKQLQIPVQEEGIKIDEIRDFRWIRNMRKTEDQGFGNEYKYDFE